MLYFYKKGSLGNNKEGTIKLKTGYPLAPQDHGLVSALKIISKH